MDKPYIVTVLRPLKKKEAKKITEEASHISVLTISFSSELEANKILENMVFNELHENYKVALSYEPLSDIAKLN